MRKISRRAGVAIIAVCVAGCSGSSAPIPPTATTSPVTAPVPAPAPVRVVTVSGVVLEGTSPIGYARVDVWYNRYLGSDMTAANGAFRLTNVPADATAWLAAFKNGYAQPCAVPVTL